MFALFFVSLIAGFFSTLFGIGGGIVVAPMLMYLFPIWSSHTLTVNAVGALTAFQGFASGMLSIWANVKREPLDYNLFVFFGLPLIFSNLLGSILSCELESKYFVPLLAFLCVLSLSFSVLRSPFFENYINNNLKITSAIMIGFVCGVVGQGGGFLYLPFLMNVLGLNVRTAISTTALIGFLASAFCCLGRFSEIIHLGYELIFLIIGIYIGSWLANVFSNKITDCKLKKYSNLFIATISLLLIMKSCVA